MHHLYLNAVFLKKKKKVLFVNKVTVNQKPFGILALVFYQPFKN